MKKPHLFFLFQLEVKNFSNENTQSRTLVYISPVPHALCIFLMGCFYKPGNKLHLKKIVISLYWNVAEAEAKVAHGCGSLMGRRGVPQSEE